MKSYQNLAIETKKKKKNAEKEQAVQPNTCAYRDGRKLGRKQTVFCAPYKHCASAQKAAD